MFCENTELHIHIIFKPCTCENITLLFNNLLFPYKGELSRVRRAYVRGGGVRGVRVTF